MTVRKLNTVVNGHSTKGEAQERVYHMTDTKRDGVGEYLVITSLQPMVTRRGWGVTYWEARGKLDGLTMLLQVWKEDYKLFTEAGYPADLFKGNAAKSDLNITVITDRRAGVFRVGSVEPREPIAVPVVDTGVLSNRERITKWLDDVKVCGSPDTNTFPLTAIFNHPSLGVIRWFKNADMTYTRLQGDDKQVFARKEYTPPQPKPAVHSIKNASPLIRHIEAHDDYVDYGDRTPDGGKWS